MFLLPSSEDCGAFPYPVVTAMNFISSTATSSWLRTPPGAVPLSEVPPADVSASELGRLRGLSVSRRHRNELHQFHGHFVLAAHPAGRGPAIGSAAGGCFWFRARKTAGPFRIPSSPQ